MILQQTADIEALIEQAKTRDSENEQLNRVLKQRADSLHGAIKLPPETAVESLRAFVERYVEHVPAFIRAIDALSHEAGIHERIAPLLNIACEYFLSPPDLINGRSQLEALLDEAYLAHRLLEEINDRFIGYCGIPLAPMDSTRANIIAHELIGEPFANELDQAVLFSAELLLNEYNLQTDNFKQYMDLNKDRGWSEELKRWPCLEDELDIDIQFG